MSTATHGPLVRKLVIAVLAMFGFAFALVPLYDVFCQITGINGKTSTVAANADRAVVDTKRQIKVEFLANPSPQMPWSFAPQVTSIMVHPGEVKRINYQAQNPTSQWMVGQAIPSVSPGQAALYFNKLECFCFNRQELQAGEQRLMPLQFYIDPALPGDIHTITLSYSLFDVTQSSPAAAGQPVVGK